MTRRKTLRERDTGRASRRRESALDTLMRRGSYGDWINPAVDVAKRVSIGGGSTLLFPLSSGLTGGEIASFLQSHGIQTWGHMIMGDKIAITVPSQQAKMAQFHLDRAGIPYE